MKTDTAELRPPDIGEVRTASTAHIADLNLAIARLDAHKPATAALWGIMTALLAAHEPRKPAGWRHPPCCDSRRNSCGEWTRLRPRLAHR